MNFQQKLDKIIKTNNSCVCVGLDSNFDKIPGFLKINKPVSEAIFSFNKKIVEATYDLVCAYKPNIAFYEAEGLEGLKALKKTIEFIKKKNPNLLVIVDAKRGDIGSTNIGYVKSLFDFYSFDALTVHPYLGKESLEPFLKRKDKGIIVLCRTSNPGAGEFQDLIVSNKNGKKMPLYLAIARKVENSWNKNNNCALVVGATYPKELAQIRKIVPAMPFLIPGIGIQGGDIKKTIQAGRNKDGRGVIINSSRGIIFSSSARNFDKIARDKTLKLKKEINKYR
ncbi:orotidine-5'-phosphate decarboxylase [Candidatus Beckwithbacteria bacterium CG10_big_fil_rev_8_21_14_0_10_34_10]|uniref:Orotidine 5'-phosphate decarboxylase n=1 Tax=Candidatus Beckwithbacteria bacterium CG10_big_fil_rev_8_21_14_0_10_34_10 TaxID=1974495 RepID=A0A2H0WAD9_9BACT|nr:MAG: orotidine-5'-phosphate decarboxylase [Candidatus Beckwithbacteria bacterium CG10_big_fil_rev_8_21_14_0_10_34_10]